MRPFRLLALFLALAACVPITRTHPASAAPISQAAPSKKPLPTPSLNFWYSWDWNGADFNPALIRSVGCTEILAVSVWKFGPQNAPLSLDQLRADAQLIKAKCGDLHVWWTFDFVRQAGNPLPSSPSRTLVDVPQRPMLLDNLASIGRVAKEMGFAGVGVDVEPYSAALVYPDEKQGRLWGNQLVTQGWRRDNSGLKLVFFGPLKSCAAHPGFTPLIRGICEKSNPIVFTEDTYGLARIDAKKAIKQTQNLIGVGTAGLGWFPEGHVPAEQVPGIIAAAAPNVRLAGAGGRPRLIYREGGMLLDEAPAEALRQALAN